MARPGASNVGNGLVSIGGVPDDRPYRIVLTGATSFALRDNHGTTLGSGTVGTAYDSGGFAFTVGAGSAPFVSGDLFDRSPGIATVISGNRARDGRTGTARTLKWLVWASASLGPLIRVADNHADNLVTTGFGTRRASTRGNGPISSVGVVPGTADGVYGVVFTSSGAGAAYDVRRPDGTTIGSGSIAHPFLGGGLSFTVFDMPYTPASGPVGANVGNGTIAVSSVATDGTAHGTYRVVMTSATAFDLRDAADVTVGSGNVGTPCAATGLTFTVTAGATPFVAGDDFYIIGPNYYLAGDVIDVAVGQHAIRDNNDTLLDVGNVVGIDRTWRAKVPLRFPGGASDGDFDVNGTLFAGELTLDGDSFGVPTRISWRVAEDLYWQLIRDETGALTLNQFNPATAEVLHSPVIFDTDGVIHLASGRVTISPDGEIAFLGAGARLAWPDHADNAAALSGGMTAGQAYWNTTTHLLTKVV
jgi:hypothetical protein